MAYIIQSGDTLSGIAAKNKTTVADILKLNPTIKDPNKIYAGSSLNLSAPAALPNPTPAPTTNVSTGSSYQAPTAGVPSASTDPTKDAYRYDGSPSVYRASDNYEFHSMDELIKSGIDPTKVRVVKDPNKAIADQIAKAGGDVKDLQSLVPLTGAEKAGIRSDLGIPDLEKQVFTPPSKNTQQLYQDAYDSAGLKDAKDKIAALLEVINAESTKFNAGLDAINENPWLSEATRVGRVKRDTDSFNRQIQTKIDQVKSLTDLYNNGVAEVNSFVTRASTDQANTQALNSAHLDYLLKQAESAQADKANEKLSRYLPTFLQTKSASAKPDTIGSDATGYYKWDKDKGTFVQIIAPVKNLSFQETANGNVVFDPKTGNVTQVLNVPPGSLISPTPQQNKIVAGYDLTSYATDPKMGINVQSIYNKVADVSDANSADAAIQSLKKGSPVKGADVIAAAQKFGVDPKLMIAIMMNDSSLGTAGKGAKTYNPGNVGNTDSGATKNYGNWSAGVEAVAQNLSKRRLSDVSAPGSNFGSLSATDKSRALNWLLTQPGHSDDDMNKLQNDREFQAWALKQAIVAGF